MQEQTLSGAVIVETAFGLNDGRRFAPGHIVPDVPRADSERAGERSLAQYCAQYGTDLEAWWGAPFAAAPARGRDGKLYPQLLARPATGHLYVRLEPWTLRAFSECARFDQLAAVRRCRDPHLLAQVEGGGYGLAVRLLARELRAGGIDNADKPLAIEMSSAPGGSLTPVVVTAAGQELATTEFWATELAPVIAQISDKALLATIAAHDGRDPLKAVLDARQQELESVPAEAYQVDYASGSLTFEEDADALGRDDEVGLTSQPFAVDAANMIRVVDGENLVPVTEYTVEELKARVEDCTDLELLGQLFEADERKTLRAAITERVGQLTGGGS